MTSTPFTSGVPDADEHPDVAEISALMEGIAAPERATQVRAHLDGCELCTDVRSSLEEIRTSLGTLPEPSRMPADIAGRIDAALAAEALLSGPPAEEHGDGVSRETWPASPSLSPQSGSTAESGVPDEPDAPRRSTVGPRHSAHRARTAPSQSPAAAVSRETSATRSSGPGRRIGSPAGHSDVTRGPGRDRPPRRARRWRTSVLAAAGAIAVFGIGGLVVNSLNSSGTGGTSHGGSQSAQASAGEDAALKHRVQHLLADAKAPKSTGAPDLTKGQSPGDAPMAGGTTTVPSCIRRGLHRTETPLAVDEHAPYKDRSGYLVVLPHKGGGAAQVDAYIVDAGCINGEHAGAADVLLKRTYPRR